MSAVRNLIGLPPARLSEELSDWADRPYRVRQLFGAIHHQGLRRFSEITSLPRRSRELLDDNYSLACPEPENVSTSSDGTSKYLFSLHDGATVEAVEIPESTRRTLCISSQAGCALACRFCVTGYWGAGRDLNSSEIVGQVYSILDRGPSDASSLSIVFMGMGEPLVNLGAVKDALEVLSVTVPWRRMTVSTAGIVPGIVEMASWAQRPNLALSLHAASDAKRNRVMPINKRYPLRDLLGAAGRYPATRHRPLLVEYILIAGFNDTRADAAALSRRLRDLHVKINLIPMNPDPTLGDELRPPSRSVVRAFQRDLIQRGIACSVRRPRGDDVNAACGQLRAAGRSPRGFPPSGLAPH